LHVEIILVALDKTMRKGRLPTGKSGQSEGGQDGEVCICNNSNFVSHVCRQCRELICSNCRSGEHSHHESGKINVVACELRNDIEENVSKQTKSDVSNSVQKSKQMIVKMRKKLITIKTNEIEKIDKRVNELHKELDEIRTELVKRVDTIVRKDIDYLKKAEMDLDKTALSIKSILDAAKNMLEKSNDIDIVKGGYSMCESLNDISKMEVATPDKGRAFSVQFIPGTSVVHDIENMFGEVSIICFYFTKYEIANNMKLLHYIVTNNLL